jgi:hypothetical protein
MARRFGAVIDEVAAATPMAVLGVEAKATAIPVATMTAEPQSTSAPRELVGFT